MMQTPAHGTLIFAGLVATLAAIFASSGDFILLAHGAARVAGDRTVDDTVLIAGHFLGVLCIPVYAAGYWMIGQAVGAAGRWTRAIFPLGCYFAAVGAAIHGVTAILIETNLNAAGGGGITQVPHAIYLLPLWFVVLGAAIGVSFIFAAAVLSGRSGFPRWLAWCNPALLTVAVVVASAPFPAAAAYLIPASANLVHVAFFGLATVLVWRGGSGRPPSPVS